MEQAPDGTFQLDLSPADRDYFQSEYIHDTGVVSYIFHQSNTFLVGQRLGSGGFGSVQVATDRNTGKRVAFKFHDMTTVEDVEEEVDNLNLLLRTVGTGRDRAWLMLPDAMFWAMQGRRKVQLAISMEYFP